MMLGVHRKFVVVARGSRSQRHTGLTSLVEEPGPAIVQAEEGDGGGPFDALPVAHQHGREGVAIACFGSFGGIVERTGHADDGGLQRGGGGTPGLGLLDETGEVVEKPGLAEEITRHLGQVGPIGRPVSFAGLVEGYVAQVVESGRGGDPVDAGSVEPEGLGQRAAYTAVRSP